MSINMTKEVELMNTCLFKTISQLFPKSEENYNKVLQEYKKEEELKQNQQNLAISDWVRQEGQRYLEESMRKLNLDANKDIRADLHTLSLDYLNKAKKVVKNELKFYDECFKAHFNSLPNRHEKEPMRPLYVYYKKLKIAITHKEKEESLNSKGDKDPSNVNLAKSNDSIEQKETFANVQRTKSESQSQPQESKGFKLNLTKLGNNPQESAEQAAAQVKIEKEQKLNGLLNRKGVLRNVLQQYQQEFLQKNVRRIKFHRDILPVENEYYEYKDVKKEIEQLEIELYGQANTKKDDFM